MADPVDTAGTSETGRFWQRTNLRPVRFAVVQFLAWALISLLVLAFVWASVLRNASYREAILRARSETSVIGRGIVGPALTDQVFANDVTYRAQIDRIVRESVLPLGVKRMKLWSPDGTVLYSDEPRLVGETYELNDDKIAVLRTGKSAASVSDLDEPENRFEPRGSNYIEVYHLLKASSGKPLLLETYYSTESITQNRNRVFKSFRPILIGALATLAVLVAPLLWSTIRTLRRSQDAQETLLRQAIASSDMERSRIARDLHDGVVQDLAGVSLTIAGVLDRLGPNREPELRGPLTEAAASTRHGIRQLRTLLVDLVPRDLSRTGLEPALSDLMSGLNQDGMRTTLNVEAQLSLNDTEQSLIYRTTQESIRNVRRHAKATQVDVSVKLVGNHVELSIIDDGVGFDPGEKRPDGNMGVELVRTAAANHGAMYSVKSAPGSGTIVSLSLPSRTRSGKR
jgi:two-component system, NarL family, sensor kinase